MKFNDTKRYEDIMDMDHPEPKNYRRLPKIKRASQFAPFAALSGHSEAVLETERLTDRKIKLSEQMMVFLDERFSYLKENLDKKLKVKISYFVKDKSKEGGSYQEKLGVIKKFDQVNRAIVMTDGAIIPIDDIVNIDCSEFNKLI